MTCTPNSLLGIAGAALALAVACSAANAASVRREASGALRYYDDNGFDRGYAWCMRRAGRATSGWADCSYATVAQCRAASFNGTYGYCEPNGFSYYVEPRSPYPEPRPAQARRR